MTEHGRRSHHLPGSGMRSAWHLRRLQLRREDRRRRVHQRAGGGRPSTRAAGQKSRLLRPLLARGLEPANYPARRPKCRRGARRLDAAASAAASATARTRSPADDAASHALALALASSRPTSSDRGRSSTSTVRPTSRPWRTRAATRSTACSARTGDARGPTSRSRTPVLTTRTHDDWASHAQLHRFRSLASQGWTSAEFDLLAAKAHRLPLSRSTAAVEHAARDTLACSPTRRGVQGCTFTLRNRSCRVGNGNAHSVSRSSLRTVEQGVQREDLRAVRALGENARLRAKQGV